MSPFVTDQTPPITESEYTVAAPTHNVSCPEIGLMGPKEEILTTTLVMSDVIPSVTPTENESTPVYPAVGVYVNPVGITKLPVEDVENEAIKVPCKGATNTFHVNEADELESRTLSSVSTL